MPDVRERIAENLRQVRERIAAAAQRSGRDPQSVRLVAVCKYVDAAVTRELLACGATELGESRPQALWEKAAELADLRPCWHLIGHLQRNKVARTVPLINWLQSVDSVRLARAVQQVAEQSGRQLDILVEINISGEAAKHGFAPGEAQAALEQIAACNHLRVRGLMSMASREADLSLARRQFAALRRLAETLEVPRPDEFDQLSMGMSGDFEVAIEEGATMVRVGSQLFAGLLS